MVQSIQCARGGVARPHGVLVLFPGALGDLLCALPAIVALRRASSASMRLVVRPPLGELLQIPHTHVISMDRPELANLFSVNAPLAPATLRLLGGAEVVHSWTGDGVPDFDRRLQQLGAARVALHPFRGAGPGEHAIDYYARCVGLAPAGTADVIAEDAAALARVGGPPALVLHPGSGSRRKNWEGFDAVAERWQARHGAPALALHGPAEAERGVPALRHARTVGGLSLPAVAALLRGCRLFVGNDCGIAHLAAAVGAAGIALFGPSDPTTWSPRSISFQVLRGASSCATCGPERFCTHRLTVDAVLDAIDAHPATRTPAARPA